MTSAAAPAGAPGLAEAVRWVRAQLGPRPMPAMAVVVGGDGLVAAAIEALRPDVRLLLLEPDPAVAARPMHGAASARLTAEGRCRCLAGPNYAGADEAWRLFPDDPDDHVVLVTPRAAAMRAAAIDAARVFGRILFGARANLTARRQFAPRYLLNSLANLGGLARGSRVDALAGEWTGTPAVVVGAGPSLDAALPALAELAPRAVVIATDTSLRPLLHAGIVPQMVVGADPSDRNARHFLDLPRCDDTWLVAESALDPRAAEGFAGRTSWFRVADHEPWPWLRTLGIDTAGLDMWGSVLTAAYQTAHLAGCDPIVFVGADLAFTHGRPYARGTTYEFEWAYSAALGSSLDEAWRQQIAMSGPVSEVGLDGRVVETSQPLQAFRDWLVARSAHAGRRVVNATGGGILAGPGIQQASLREVLRGRDPVARRVRGTRPTSVAAPGEIMTHVAALRSEIARGDRTTPLLARWAAFALAPLDLAGLDGALAGAAHALAAGPAAASRRVFVPWAALTSCGLDLARLRHLPEDIAASQVSAPADGASVRQAILLAEVTSQAAATAPPAAREPASASSPDPSHLLWPPEVAWPLRVFDAVLPPRRESTPAGYFDQPVAVEAVPGSHRVSVAARLASHLTARWLLAAADLATPAARLRLRGMAAAVAAESGRASEATAPPALVTIAVGGDGATHTEHRSVARQVAARALTGALVVSPPRADRARLAEVNAATVFVSVDVAGLSALVTPRVLTEEGLARATCAVTAAGAVVVAPLHADHSIRIGEDGTWRRHLTWPASIVGELPVGEGVVAWSNGTASWPEVGEGYLLYRATRQGLVARLPLPFRPTAGVCFAGRVYWNAFRTGLGVWAPGTTPSACFEAESFSGVAVDDGRLILAPASRDAQGRVVRRAHAEAWALAADGTVGRHALPPEGAAVSVASGPRWTARAHPDADLIRLVAGPCRIDLICHHPMAVAWAERSLVVCTAAGEVLLFERLTDTLDTLV